MHYTIFFACENRKMVTLWNFVQSIAVVSMYIDGNKTYIERIAQPSFLNFVLVFK